MNFHKIKVESIGDSKYAWANGYGPIAENIDDIPFLKSKSDQFKQDQLKFWEISNYPPGIKFDPGGKEWPDVLGCGGNSPSFFFSERILVDLRETGISYLRATEMPLMHPYPKKLREMTPPAYYVVEGAPGIAVSWAAMGIPHNSNNESDFSKGLPKPWPPEEWKVSLASWSGLDLMSYYNWQAPMTLVCTDAVVELAKAKKWSNINFSPLTPVK